MSQKQFSRSVIENGNSLSVTLPEGWLERVGVEKGDELFIEADDGSIRFIAD